MYLPFIAQERISYKAKKWVIQLLMSITASMHGEIQQCDTNRTLNFPFSLSAIIGARDIPMIKTEYGIQDYWT